jgi:hypothetical protein
MIYRNYPYKGMKGRGVAIISEDIQKNLSINVKQQQIYEIFYNLLLSSLRVDK